MLLIWDIHIHPRYSDGIISMLRDFVQTHNDERTIVFVGDYVYHFSYHRSSLLALLDFFIELREQGKEVYVLAGNHDWLGQHFVYAEAEKIMKSEKWIVSHDGKEWWPWSLYFVTTPQIVRIESEDVFFLPYMLNRKDSEELNHYIQERLGEWEQSHQGKTLTLIHHYYVAETAFPGLKVKFSYKDLALAPRWLDDERIKLISGHIHHPFTYKNYLCVWAVWSTSPQELNQLQYLFSYDLSKKEVLAYQVLYNSYLQIEKTQESLNASSLEQFWINLQHHHSSNLLSGNFAIEIIPCDIDSTKISLFLLSNDIDYDTLDNHIDQTLMSSFSDVKIKRSYESSDMIVSQLIDQSQNFSSWRGDRKILLDDYLTQKFGDRKEKYEDMLKEIGI